MLSILWGSIKEINMNDRTRSKGIEKQGTKEDEILRAAREYLERTAGASGHGKPGRTPRKDRPKLRGAPAATAVIEGRG